MLTKSTVLLSFITMMSNYFTSANTIEVQTTEAFILSLNQLINLTEEGNAVWFRPSLHDAPDLPKWISYCYSNIHETGFIYGVPEDSFSAKIDIVVFNRKTFETVTHNFNLVAKERTVQAKYAVQFKITNLSIEDMLEGEKLDAVLKVLKKHLWPESSHDLYVTFMESAPTMGYRIPTEPSEKEGVLLRFGSEMPFSSTLEMIQEEVTVLNKHSTCPKGFKKASAERYFREDHFFVDWCSFKLIEINNSNLVSKQIKEIYNVLPVDLHMLPSRDQIGIRDYFFDFLSTIIIPIVMLIILLIVLSLIMCIDTVGEKVVVPEIQMVQYASNHEVGDLQCPSLQSELNDKTIRNVLV